VTKPNDIIKTKAGPVERFAGSAAAFALPTSTSTALGRKNPASVIPAALGQRLD
jgi:hypothetical protein